MNDVNGTEAVIRVGTDTEGADRGLASAPEHVLLAVSRCTVSELRQR